jgi:heme-degrading monooxygenase HmoA
MTAKDSELDGPIITLLHLKVDPQMSEEVIAAYHQLTPHLLDGVPELISSTLVQNRDPQSQEPYLIVSQWENLAAYRMWESSDEHRQELRPLVRLVNGLRPETFRCVG